MDHLLDPCFLSCLGLKKRVLIYLDKYSPATLIHLVITIYDNYYYSYMCVYIYVLYIYAYTTCSINVCVYIYICKYDFLKYLFIYLFIYLFMAVLGLRFCARAFSSCGEWGPLFIAARGPLTIAASLVAEHRLQTRRLSNCGSRA